MPTFLIDECVSMQTQILIERLGFNVENVKDLGLKGASDKDVFRLAQETGKILVTNDRGFGDVRKYPPSSHKGVIVIKAHDLKSLLNCHRTLESLLATEHEFKGILFVVNENKYRKKKRS